MVWDLVLVATGDDGMDGNSIISIGDAEGWGDESLSLFIMKGIVLEFIGVDDDGGVIGTQVEVDGSDGVILIEGCVVGIEWYPKDVFTVLLLRSGKYCWFCLLNRDIILMKATTHDIMHIVEMATQIQNPIKTNIHIYTSLKN